MSSFSALANLLCKSKIEKQIRSVHLQVIKIKSKVWVYGGSATQSFNAAAMKGAWHFITIPKGPASFIRNFYGHQAKGWGSIPVQITLGKTTWETSIFPDSKLGTYVLPLKKRGAEKRKYQRQG